MIKEEMNYLVFLRNSFRLRAILIFKRCLRNYKLAQFGGSFSIVKVTVLNFQSDSSQLFK